MATPAMLLRAWLVLLLGERAVELGLSARHARALIARGGVEAGRGHYPAMVLLHLAFLVACAAEPVLAPRPWPLSVSMGALAASLLAMAIRWWAIAALGPRWTTRIVVLRGAPPRTKGPYRFLRHPNYLAVAVEILCVPLIGGAVVTAVLFTLANAVLLVAVRIPAEEAALGPAWRSAFAGRRRAARGALTHRSAGRP
jgi:methyltransferase